MWIEQRRQQHRVYWRKPTGGKDYQPFANRTDAEKFVALCRTHGRATVLARLDAREATGAGR